MTKNALTIKNIRFWLFLCLILGAPLSKYPSFSMPEFNFSSFRFGLYQLLAALFLLFCIWPVAKNIKSLYSQNRVAFLSLAILAIIVIIGPASALYKARSSLLAVSILFLLMLVVCGWWYVKHELQPSKYPFILKSILIAGIIFSIAGLIQFALSTFTDNSFGILCSGCAASILGFPRINVFAAEPEFYANALLPFFFLSLGVVYKSKSRLGMAALMLTSLALVLAFSRGAFAACVVGLATFLILLLLGRKSSFKPLGSAVLLIVMSGVVGVSLLLGSAIYRYHSTPNIAYNTTRTILDQASDGIINLPAKNSAKTSLNIVTSSASSSSFVSPGLIKASGQERLSAAKLSLKAWRYNSKTIIIGVGSGNLGPFVNKYIDAATPNNLTVYIYYALLLAELGLIGLISFIILNLAGLLQFIRRYKKSKHFAIYASIASLMVAFLVQYCFFGTYINTVYIWLWLGIILGLAGLPLTKKAV